MIAPKIVARILWTAAVGFVACAAAMGQIASVGSGSGTRDQEMTKALQAVPERAPSTKTGFGERDPRYRICSGDVIEISFALQPEFNQSITVQPDGFVSLRQAGDLHASGLTVPEFKAMLTSRYGEFLNKPDIEVQLKDFVKAYFVADGQVGRPGKYELRGDTTVTEGIAMAGGMNSSAKHSQVLLFRRANEHWFETKVIDLKKMVKEKNLDEDIVLQPGDLIFVPQNRVSKFQRFVPSPGMGMALTP